MYQIKSVFALFLMLILTACGFQMRGDWALPSVMQDTTLVGGSRALHAELERGFRSASASLTRGGIASPGTRLRVSGEKMDRRVMSVDNTGKAIEYEIYYILVFDVLDGEGKVLIEKQNLSMTRDYLYAATDVHGTSRNEQLLRDDMRREMSQRIMRRIHTLLK